MIPLTLPSEDRRTLLRSFWLVISLGFAMAVWLVCWTIQIPFPWVLGIAAGIACGSAAFVAEEFVRRLYRAWNRRLVRPLGDLASHGVMTVLFFVVFVVASRLGSRVRLDGPAGTTWEPRGSLPNNAYELLFAGQGSLPEKAGWMRGYIHWALRTGNTWSISLLPFLWLLRLLSDSEQKATEANIYTLF